MLVDISRHPRLAHPIGHTAIFQRLTDALPEGQLREPEIKMPIAVEEISRALAAHERDLLGNDHTPRRVKNW
jgi:hypothetical protein